jgi:hypothetical protein
MPNITLPMFESVKENFADISPGRYVHVLPTTSTGHGTLGRYVGRDRFGNVVLEDAVSFSMCFGETAIHPIVAATVIQADKVLRMDVVPEDIKPEDIFQRWLKK